MSTTEPLEADLLLPPHNLSHESIYEFAFIGACLKIRGGTGSPMRPIALPLRS